MPSSPEIPAEKALEGADQKAPSFLNAFDAPIQTRVRNVDTGETVLGFQNFPDRFPIGAENDWEARYQQLYRRHLLALPVVAPLNFANNHRIPTFIAAVVATGALGAPLIAHENADPSSSSANQGKDQPETVRIISGSTSTPTSSPQTSATPHSSTANKHYVPPAYRLWPQMTPTTSADSEPIRRTQHQLDAAKQQIKQDLQLHQQDKQQIKALQQTVQKMSGEQPKPKVIIKTETVEVPGPERVRTVHETKRILVCAMPSRYENGHLVDPKIVDCSGIPGVDTLSPEQTQPPISVDAVENQLLTSYILALGHGTAHPTPSPSESPSASESPSSTALPTTSPTESSEPSATAAATPSETAPLPHPVHRVLRRVLVANQLGGSHHKRGYMSGVIRSRLMARQARLQKADLAILTENEHPQAVSFLNAMGGKWGMVYPKYDTRNAVAYRRAAFENVTDQHRDEATYNNVYFGGSRFVDAIAWLKDRETGQLTIILPVHNAANTGEHPRQGAFRNHAVAIENTVIRHLHEKYPSATIMLGGDFNDKGLAQRQILGGHVSSPLSEERVQNNDAPIDRVEGLNINFVSYKNIQGEAIDEITDHHHIYVAGFTTPVPGGQAGAVHQHTAHTAKHVKHPITTGLTIPSVMRNSEEYLRNEVTRQTKANGGKKPEMVVNVDFDHTFANTVNGHFEPISEVVDFAKEANRLGVGVDINTGRTKDQIAGISKWIARTGVTLDEICTRREGLSIEAGKQACRVHFRAEGNKIIANVTNRRVDTIGNDNYGRAFVFPNPGDKNS